MFKENQQPNDSDHGIETSESSYTAPYRHRGYKKALYALRDALDNQNAVILKGVEGTGKTTLISELMSDYQRKGVPVIRFSSRLTKVSQFYSQLAECLEVPKHKKDLIRALRNTKKAGQYCLVVIDQEAIQSSADIAETLKQLCLTSETTARSIKLVVIRKDYLVIHTEGTPEADFHNWIETEVTLNPLQTDDIEGFIYYLSAIKGLQPTPYEIGTDFVMIEQSEGRISHLKALLLPLIHKDVITQRDFSRSDKTNKPLHPNHSGIIALAFVILLAMGVGLNHFFFSDTSISSAPSKIASLDTKAGEKPVFAEPSKQENATAYKVTPPLASNTNASNTNVANSNTATIQTINDKASNSNISENSDLPILDPEIADNLKPIKERPESSLKVATTQLNETLQVADKKIPEHKKTADITKAPTQTEKSDSSSLLVDEELASLTQEEFQTEMKIRLLLLEQELTEAVVENNRLKIALLETKDEKTKQVIEQSNTEVTTDTVVTQNKTTETVVATQTSSEPPSATVVKNPVAVNESDTFETSPLSETASDSLTKDEPSSNLEQVTRLIERWQEAWQTQNHESYSNSYTANFNGAYKTHQRWLKKRYAALTSPKWIKLSRSELTNIQQSDSDIKVDFWVNYEADSGYKDKTLKRLTLINVDGQWLISKEQNLQVKPFF